MKILVFFYLQLEQFWRNPALWFGQQFWVVRLAVVLLLFPAISGVTLFWLTAFGTQSRETVELQRATSAELLHLKDLYKKDQQRSDQVLSRMQAELSEVRALLSIRDSVNGDATTDSATSEFGGLESTTPKSATTTQVIRVLGAESSQLPIYAAASDTASPSGYVAGRSLYLVTTTQNEWYEIELSPGKNGWIQSVIVEEVL